MIESILFEQPQARGARIKVVGVGGCGGNAVNNLADSNLAHIQFLAANTDIQALGVSLADHKLQIGGVLTSGLGAGGDPEIGHRAALEDIDQLRAHLADADMVFICAGMGGGTGTGAAPVVAQAARDAGALTVAVVTRPFTFEGRQRARQAEEGLRELAQAVDTLIVIPNDRIFQIASPRIPIKEAFRLVDSVVVEAVRGISDMIACPGLINVDFADVRSIMKGKGMALMGTGRGTGDDRAAMAARAAISSPLLEDARIEGATGLLVTITGGLDLSLADMNDAMNLIQDAAAADTNTIFGAIFDESMGDEIKVTVVATGFDRAAVVRSQETQHTRLYNASRVGAALGAGQERPGLHVVPPPPPPGRAQLDEEVPVYAVAAAAHERTLMANQAMHTNQAMHSAPTRQMPAAQASSGHSAAMQPPQPPPLPHHEHELDEPAYLRKLTPGYGVPQVPAGMGSKREPVVHNPFASATTDIDRPAFRRK